MMILMATITIGTQSLRRISQQAQLKIVVIAVTAPIDHRIGESHGIAKPMFGGNWGLEAGDVMIEKQRVE